MEILPKSPDLPVSDKIKTKLDWFECGTLFQAGRLFEH